MNKRWRFVVVGATVLTLGGVGLWFGVFRQRQEVEKTPKTTAELLIGSWKMTECHHPPLAPDVEMLIVFTENGRFEVHSVDHRNGHQLRVGTYRLEGSTVHFSAEPNARYEAMTWEETIDVLSAEKLTLVGLPEHPGDKQPRSDFRRTHEKRLVAPPRTPSGNRG